MGRLPSRFCALAIVLFLIAAHLHVWVEASPARAPGHACEVCISGGWAIVSARPGLEVTLRTLRLEAEPPQVMARSQRTEASAPRAPPYA